MTKTMLAMILLSGYGYPIPITLVAEAHLEYACAPNYRAQIPAPLLPSGLQLNGRVKPHKA